MAIDTENKRRSTQWVLPVADGTITAADRAQALRQYSGIAIDAPAAATGNTTLRGFVQGGPRPIQSFMA